MKFKSKGSSNGGVGGKDFLKLAPGGSVKGVFRGDPHEFHIHWVGNRSSLCPEDASCEMCREGTNKHKFRFRLNFLINENGAYVPKVFEQGWTFYCQLRDLHASDYDLEKTIVKITRNGEGKNTTYTIIPVPNGVVTADLEKKLAAIALIPLGDDSAPEPDESGDDDNEDVPF